MRIRVLITKFNNLLHLPVNQLTDEMFLFLDQRRFYFALLSLYQSDTHLELLDPLLDGVDVGADVQPTQSVQLRL